MSSRAHRFATFERRDGRVERWIAQRDEHHSDKQRAGNEKSRLGSRAR
jgi:hypothetical protein